MTDRSGFLQVRATWHEGASPAEARTTPEDTAHRLRVEEQFADRGIESFQVDPDIPLPDPETEAAVQLARDEGLISIIRSAGVEIGHQVPLLLGHSGPALAEELDIGVRGHEFSATGWVPAGQAAQIRDIAHCSPRFSTSKARIVDHGYGIRFLDVIACRLLEVSATREPLRERTSFMVAPQAGLRFWAPPTWADSERFTRAETGSFRLALAGPVEVL